MSEAVPLLAELLSIPTGDRYPPLNRTPQKRKEKTLHAQLAQVDGLAAHSLYFPSAVAQVLGDTVLSAQRDEASRRIATDHDVVLVRAWSAGVLGWCVAATLIAALDY